jgi:uncharacterized protein YjbI with pentapeptide repeats
MVGHHHMEALPMRGRTRALWKAGITIAGVLLLLLLMAWIPVAAAGAEARASGLVTPVTVATSPTANSTITAETANEQLRMLQRDNDRSWQAWFWNNGATILSAVLSTLVIVIGALFGLWRWRSDRRTAQDKELKDRQNEREKRAEERFQSVVTGLGDEKEGARVGAAILLRTFLRPGYEEFYTQTFDLAVANLRLPRTPPPSEDPDGLSRIPEDSNTPLPLTTLSQALIVVFKEAFPLARSQNKESPQPLVVPGIQFPLIMTGIESLDASRIQLDNAFLGEADLKQVSMTQASLREANLSQANLSQANLGKADLRGAILNGADLSEANLVSANLSKADLIGADLSKAILFLDDLSEADLSGADLSKASLLLANLSKANLSGADLGEADLSGADLSRAQFSNANLSGAYLYKANLSGADLGEADLSKGDLDGADLSGANIEDAQSLKDANLHEVKGLTKEQRASCKAK